jgi:hypothetical protein
MDTNVPGRHGYKGDKSKPLGHCLTCEYNGPMEKGATEYECPVCHGTALELYLCEGHHHRVVPSKDDHTI